MRVCASEREREREVCVCVSVSVCVCCVCVCARARVRARGGLSADLVQARPRIGLVHGIASGRLFV